MEQLDHELLNVGLVYPGSAQTHLDFAGLQVFRLCLDERFHISGKEGVLLRNSLGGTELLAHIAGEVFVRSLPALIPVCPAFLQVERAAGGVFIDDAVQIFHDLRDFIAAAHEGSHEAQVHMSLLANADSERFAGGIHMVNAGLLLDGAFGEHIRLALELAVIVQNFQRAEQIIGAVPGESQTVRPVID